MLDASRWKIFTLKNFAILSIGCLICLFVTIFFKAYVNVPWGDGLDAINVFLRSNATTFIFANVNEHINIVPRLLNFVDLTLGNVDFRFMTLVTLVLYLVQYLLICRYLVFVDKNAWNWWIVAVITITTFATYRLILINNPINNAHFLVGCFAFLSIISYSLQKEAIGNRKILLGFNTFFFGGLAIVTMANGILVIPIILLVHLRCSEIFLKQPIRKKVIYWGVITVASLLVFWAVVQFLTKSTVGYSDPNNLAEAFWFYFRGTALPFTGISASYFSGLILAGITNIVAIYYLLRFFLTSKKSITENVAIGLLLYSATSLIMVALFRHEHYPDFFSHGHRYGVYNLSLHLALCLLVGADLKKGNVSYKLQVLLKSGILVFAFTCLVGGVIVGNYLIERKYNFVIVANSLANNKPVDQDLFRSLAFYPSTWWARQMYAEFVKRGMYKRNF